MKVMKKKNSMDANVLSRASKRMIRIKKLK